MLYYGLLVPNYSQIRSTTGYFFYLNVILGCTITDNSQILIRLALWQAAFELQASSRKVQQMAPNDLEHCEIKVTPSMFS